MLRSTGSFEIAEWAAEYKLRAEDEELAMERSRTESGRGLSESAEDEIVRIARERGHIT